MRRLTAAVYDAGKMPKHNSKPKQQKSKKQPAATSVVTVSGEKQRRAGWAPGLMGGLGTLVGSAFGGPAGALVGKAAGNLLGRVTGAGAYQVRSNSLMGRPPSFGMTSVRVRHQEYLADVYSGFDLVSAATAFDYRQFYINPGLAATFPWLSSIANNFEEYKFHGLIFEFRTTSGQSVASSNTALGTVMMATEYDVLDPPFPSKVAMEAYMFASSTVPSCSVVHAVECQPKQNVDPVLYIRNTTPPAGADQRLYDLGFFQVATVGMQAAGVNLGEMWVTYDVELLKPKLPILGTSTGMAHLVESPTASSAAPNILGTTGAVVRFNSIPAASSSGLTAVSPHDPNSFYLSAVGTFLVVTLELTAGILTSHISLAPGANITPGPAILVDNTSSSNAASGGMVGASVSLFSVNIAGAGVGNLITLSGLAGATPPGSFDLFVIAVPPYLTVMEPLLMSRLRSIESVLAALAGLPSIRPALTREMAKFDWMKSVPTADAESAQSSNANPPSQRTASKTTGLPCGALPPINELLPMKSVFEDDETVVVPGAQAHAQCCSHAKNANANSR